MNDFENMSDEQLEDMYYENVQDCNLEAFDLVETEMIRRGLLAQA